MFCFQKFTYRKSTDVTATKSPLSAVSKVNVFIM